MDYQAALDLIWGLVNFESTPPTTREPYTLDRMRALLARLDNPQAQRPVIHVAGTKGKGSVSAMIEAVLRAAGQRTGLYSSPHLHDPRERLQLGGQPISEPHFVALVERLRPHVAALPTTTTFEALTAMAFLAFAEAALDVGVLEVGLGGRLDATNVVTPLVSVITRLDLEHTAVLGTRIEQIAAEKGGIIKAGVPIVTLAQRPEALAVLRSLAAERGAPFALTDELWAAPRRELSLAGQRFDLRRRDGSAGYEGLWLPLLGAHQIANAALAVSALEAARVQGIAWDEAALRAGLASVRWPARVEVLRRAPLVVADGAHTLESARALVETLQEAVPTGWGRSTLVLGISADKSAEALLAALAPLAERLILTRARHPRAADPVALAASLAALGHAPHIVPDVAEAMQRALADAAPDEIVVATGSLFVAAEARAALGTLHHP